MPLDSGTTLGSYEIQAPLGAGGMGEVYRARDLRLERDVALKVLPEDRLGDPVARARLLQEARSAAALNHPHICTVHEVGSASNHTFIAMELVEGQPLSDRLMSGPLPPAEVVELGRQLADALAHAHARGVVHRDLKSANVVVRPDGRLKVLDFGLAKRLTESELTAAVTQDVTALTQPGTVMGTVAYMAPEQLRGEPAGTSSDIWALGVMLHEMSAGARPFQGQTGFELSAAILKGGPDPVPDDVPRPLRTVISRCLDKDPSRRYQIGSEVSAALEAFEDGPGAEAAAPPDLAVRAPDAGPDAAPVARPPGVAAGTVSITVHKTRLIGAGAVVVAALVAALGWWVSWADAPDPRRLAVLPFENLLGEEDLEYLSEGVAESLIRQVSVLPEVRVSPLSASLNFSGGATDPVAAGERLGVEAVVAGAVSVEDDRLLVAASLVDVASGEELWSRRFERTPSDLAAVHDEIASAVLAEGLGIELTEEELGLTVTPTIDGEAYDLYLQARYLQRRAIDDFDYLEAVDLLERTVVRDPGFASAYLMLAGIHHAMGIDGYMRPADAVAQANRYMRQAEAIDPDNADLLAITHGGAFFYDWDWEGAARQREQALELRAGEFDPDWFRTYSLELLARGEADAALELARRSRELDPLSIGLAMLEADYLVHAGYLDDAVAVYQRTVEVEPDNADAYFGLAEAYRREGRYPAAGAARATAHRLLGDFVLAELFAAVTDEAGYYQVDEGWVRLQLGGLEARRPWGYVSPLDFARVHAQLGEADTAFDYLDEALEQRSPGLVLLTIDAAFDRVRDDARFADALERVGFPQLRE